MLLYNREMENETSRVKIGTRQNPLRLSSAWFRERRKYKLAQIRTLRAGENKKFTTCGYLGTARRPDAPEILRGLWSDSRDTTAGNDRGGLLSLEELPLRRRLRLRIAALNAEPSPLLLAPQIVELLLQ